MLSFDYCDLIFYNEQGSLQPRLLIKGTRNPCIFHTIGRTGLQVVLSMNLMNFGHM